MSILAWVVLIESLVIVAGVGALLWVRWRSGGARPSFHLNPTDAIRAARVKRDAAAQALRDHLNERTPWLDFFEKSPTRPPDPAHGLLPDEQRILTQLQTDPRYAGRPAADQRAAAKIMAQRAREYFGRAAQVRKTP